MLIPFPGRLERERLADKKTTQEAAHAESQRVRKRDDLVQFAFETGTNLAVFFEEVHMGVAMLTQQRAWREIPDDKVISTDEFNALCAGSRYFDRQEFRKVTELNLTARYAKWAINVVHEYAERHRWNSAAGTLVLMLRHLSDPKSHPTPLAILCMTQEQIDLVKQSGLLDIDIKRLEKHINEHPQDLNRLQAVIDAIRAMRQRTRVETNQRTKQRNSKKAHLAELTKKLTQERRDKRAKRKQEKKDKDEKKKAAPAQPTIETTQKDLMA